MNGLKQCVHVPITASGFEIVQVLWSLACGFGLGPVLPPDHRSHWPVIFLTFIMVNFLHPRGSPASDEPLWAEGGAFTHIRPLFHFLVYLYTSSNGFTWLIRLESTPLFTDYDVL